MKQENYRDYIDAGILGGSKKRFSINDILGWKDSYKANPSSGAGEGQLVFALYTGGTSIAMGQCTIGTNLIPWGIRCCFENGTSSGCSTSSSLTCGFNLGTRSYLALGSVGLCGATLWRRVS